MYSYTVRRKGSQAERARPGRALIHTWAVQRVAQAVKSTSERARTGKNISTIQKKKNQDEQ